jgi:hypothetical protein
MISHPRFIFPSLSMGDDAFFPESMKFRDVILNIPYLCNAANTHGFVAGQVDLATKSKRIRGKTFLTFFRPPGERGIRIDQPRIRFAACEERQQDTDEDY